MKRFSLSAFLLICVLSISAQWRTVEEALDVVSSFAGKAPQGMRRMPANSRPRLAYVREYEGNPLLYVFDMGQDAGFTLVSGTEASTVDVLGYTTQGSFDEQDMPCGLKWLMELYASQLEVLSGMDEAQVQDKVTARRKAPAAPVSPLIQTKWAQRAPFNGKCPNGCLTGCVATAVGQICRYYGYPTRGTGSYSYVWNGRQLSADYASTVYDWANMLEDYSGAYNTAQADAVATLLYHIGVSVNANYGMGGTEASTRNALKSLNAYFGYDDNMYFASRSNYTDAEWDELIYTELANGRPVMYDGEGGAGGHAFIVHGYADGLYCVNWGWAGVDDGWFSLSSLIPESFEYAGGFNQGQNAFLSIRPETQVGDAQVHLGAYKEWQISSSKVKSGETVSISGYTMNYGIQDQDVILSVIAVDRVSGQEIRINNVGKVSCGGVPISSYFGASLPFTTEQLLPAHSYEIIPVAESADGSRFTRLVMPAGTRLRLDIQSDTEPLISLKDGDATELYGERKCNVLTYTRTFNNTDWQPLYVPFSMKFDDWDSQGLEVARINGFYEYDIDEDGTMDQSALEVLKVKKGLLKPSHPYLVRSKTTGTKTITVANATLLMPEANSVDCRTVETEYFFTGTYTAMSQQELADKGAYIMGGGKLTPSAGALRPMRWYMQRQSRDGQLLPEIAEIKVYVQGEEDEADALDFVNAGREDGQAYNLMGQKVSGEQKGILIRNGKKYIR